MATKRQSLCWRSKFKADWLTNQSFESYQHQFETPYLIKSKYEINIKLPVSNSSFQLSISASMSLKTMLDRYDTTLILDRYSYFGWWLYKQLWREYLRPKLKSQRKITSEMTQLGKSHDHFWSILSHVTWTRVTWNRKRSQMNRQNALIIFIDIYRFLSHCSIQLGIDRQLWWRH